MRAVTYVSPGEIDIIEKPIPKIEPDEVLLEVLGAGVCHSDLNIIRSPKRRHLIGTTLGHETAGRVVEVGSAVTTVDVGEEVLSFGLKFCDRCRECLAGRQNQCMVIAHRRRDPLGHGLGLDGGMADYMAIRAQQLDSLGGLDPVACAPRAAPRCGRSTRCATGSCPTRRCSCWGSAGSGTWACRSSAP